MLVNMNTATLEEFYPAVAIATLLRIIKDLSLAQHHTMVVQAITFIFKSLGIKCVPYISQVRLGEPTYFVSMSVVYLRVFVSVAPIGLSPICVINEFSRAMR